jgi:starch synthase
VERALHHYREPEVWRQLVETGMRQDFSWRRSAERYIELYERVLTRRQYGSPLTSTTTTMPY